MKGFQNTCLSIFFKFFTAIKNIPLIRDVKIRRRVSKRGGFFLIFLALIFVTAWFTKHDNSKITSLSRALSNSSKSDNILWSEIDGEEEMACNLPKLPLFDPSIAEYVDETPPFVNCTRNGSHPLIFDSDFNRTLIQVLDPSEYNYRNCCYVQFRKKKGYLRKIKYDEVCHPITEEKTVVGPRVEFLQINCLKYNGSESESESVPVDLFGFLPPKKKRGVDSEVDKKIHQDREKESNTTKNHRRVNVIILGLDGMSHINFQRTMPLSFRFLTQNLSAIGMNGYTKVGENSFPNLVPALSGHSVEELTKICWATKDDYLDSCPFIWKNYSAHGYTTAYAEDAAPLGTFEYLKEGFKISPVDYYYSILLYHLESLLGHQDVGNAKWCYGPRLAFEIVLQFIKKMMVAMDNNNAHPYFLFNWVNSLFHDELNAGQLGDKVLLEAMEWLESGGHLKNTIFILMSDHGNRFSGILDTLQGKIEGRMPMLYLKFPAWFSRKYEMAVKNVKNNANKLTTHFDLHETLLDFLKLDKLEKLEDQEKKESESRKKKLTRGISLFQPIPASRTCGDAEIPEIFCVCQFKKSLDVENNLDVTLAARRVVHHINEMLLKYTNCRTLELDKVASAMILNSVQEPPSSEEDEDDDEVEDQNEEEEVSSTTTTTTTTTETPNSNRLSLSFSVKPSGAKFEATVSKSSEGVWDVSGEIVRTNMYGNQSWCVSEAALKIFCYCHS